MERIAIVSDTHIPGRAAAIPDAFRERIRDADRTIHAGDVESAAALDDVQDLADGRLTAVVGNIDRGLDLPATATVTVGGVTFVVTHGTGPPAGYEDRVTRTVRDAAGPDAIGVAGHTHEVLDTAVDGVRLLNPGSATGAAPADRATMMTARVEGGGLDVTVHEA